VAVERDELELIWPAQLFAQEAQALLATGRDGRDSVGWLLAEAFHDDRGLKLFDEVAGAEHFEHVEDDPGGMPPHRSYSWPRATANLLTELARDAGELPRYRPPRYYSQRLVNRADPVLGLPELKAAFGREVHRLAATGYFQDAFGSACIDVREDDPNEAGQRQLAEAVGSDQALWPVGEPDHSGSEQTWTEELFYDVVEALHDRAARPRRRRWHDYGREWDYDDFARLPGRALYRWRVNQLFDRSLVPLRLAESGSDTGRLVHAAGDPRDELVEQALTTPATDDRAAVEHAVARFRSRAATREDKRSAILALSRVLEDRRQLIKEQLTKKDEGALFRIANEFDLRHRKTGGQQRGDYDEAFLDWVFWWYLSTIALTDRLLARQAVSGG
jgi:hypothetical protein